jgi:hypothetical protein
LKDNGESDYAKARRDSKKVPRANKAVYEADRKPKDLRAADCGSLQNDIKEHTFSCNARRRQKRQLTTINLYHHTGCIEKELTEIKPAVYPAKLDSENDRKTIAICSRQGMAALWSDPFSQRATILKK